MSRTVTQPLIRHKGNSSFILRVRWEGHPEKTPMGICTGRRVHWGGDTEVHAFGSREEPGPSSSWVEPGITVCEVGSILARFLF